MVFIFSLFLTLFLKLVCIPQTKWRKVRASLPVMFPLLCNHTYWNTHTHLVLPLKAHETISLPLHRQQKCSFVHSNEKDTQSHGDNNNKKIEEERKEEAVPLKWNYLSPDISVKVHFWHETELLLKRIVALTDGTIPSWWCHLTT